MKCLRYLLFIPAFILCGCANDPNLITDVSSVLSGGVATASELAAVYAAVQQNNNGKALNAATVLSDAATALGTASTTNLASAVTNLVNSVNTTITDATAKGASTTAIVTAVSSQVVAGQDTLQAVAPSASASLHYHIGHEGRLVCQL
jgi:hypothetical protein